MNPQQKQPQFDEKAGHEAAANLSFSTAMSQLLQNGGQMPTDASQTPQDAPTQEQPANPQEDLKSMEERLMGEISGIRDMIEQQAPKDKNKEIEDLKKEIQHVLENE